MRHKALNISEVLQHWAKNFKVEDKQLHFEVDKIWLEMFGSDIYEKTIKIVVKNKVVEIYLNSPILKQELQYAKSKILLKIQAQLGNETIKDIKIL